MRIFSSITLILFLTLSLVNCQQMNHNSNLLVKFTPIYGYDVSALDEANNLFDTRTVNAKYDCFYKCASNSACMMASFKSTTNQCKLYTQVNYSVQLSSSTEPCLFERFVPDYSAINAYLTHWWPFNNDVKDIIGGSDFFSPVGSVSFTTDRLNQASSALYLNQGYYSMPGGAYISGDYTLALWVKVISITNCCDRIMALSVAGTNWYIFSLIESTGPYIASPYGTNFKSPTRLNTNKWQHLVFTLSGSTAAIYIDGNLMNQGAYGISPNNVYTQNYFGRYADGSKSNAVYDDVKMYNRSLTKTEIMKVLNSYY